MKQSDTLFVVLLAILASTFAIRAEALRKPTTTTPATRAKTTTHHARPSPPSSLLVTNVPERGGGGGGHRWKKTKSALSSTNNKKTDVASGGVSILSRFRPQATRRERVLAAWLLFWNGIALVDALMFTFRPTQNLDGYLVGSWNHAPHHTLAMTRMLANCQLALIGTIALLACTANESTLKNMFRLLILATLGAFRAVAVGVREGSVKAPWKTGYAAVMSAPPLLLLGYFAFVF
jgi:hypothetical protein